jgi:hypothetical protein
MPLSDEERRKRERERKARQRAQKRAAPKLEALPQIGPGSGTSGGTQGGTPEGTGAESEHPDLTIVSAAREVIASLEVPASARWRIPLVLRLALDLDSPGAVPQRASLADRYAVQLEALVAAAKPRERDALDDLRFKFYTGSVDDIDDDPEATQPRQTRRKA